MKKLIPVLVMLFFLNACERNFDSERSNDIFNSYLTAKIVGYDLNCSTCILEFPNDFSKISEELGQSQNNFYQAINMSRGDYRIGQMLKVRIRKPKSGELKACITMYPSYNYKELYVTDSKGFNNMIFGDTVSIACHDCLYDPENLNYICLDSVLNDSRCPTGVYCIWEGNATVRFKFVNSNELPVLFELNTHKGFVNDTVVSGYRFTLIDLSPYPKLDQRIDQKEYEAELFIEEE